MYGDGFLKPIILFISLKQHLKINNSKVARKRALIAKDFDHIQEA